MNEKHYDNDPAKAKSRELVRDMIKKTVISFRRPQEMKVLCFPGVTATEVHEVYDKLNIPRGNIVGLERERSLISRIQENAPGINVVNQTAEEYIAAQKEIDFDIVSLDYTGPINAKQLDTIKRISRIQKRDYFVLHTANSVRRDGSSLDTYAEGYAGFSYKHEILRTLDSAVEGGQTLFPDMSFDDFKDRMSGVVERANSGESIADEKSNGYTFVIARALNERTSQDFDRFNRFVLGEHYDEVENYIRRQLRLHEEVDPFALYESITKLVDQVFSKLCSRIVVNKTPAADLVNLCAFDGIKSEKFFDTLKLSRYSYISESGTPMIGDIRFVSYPRRYAQTSRSLIECLGYPGVLKFCPHTKFIKVVRECIGEMGRFAKKKGNGTMALYDVEREFLGSASKPVMTKRRYIEALREDRERSDAEITSGYRGWNNMPLPQWRAHFTMGTYNEKPERIEPTQGEELILVQGGEEEIDRLTKADAIDLLGSGIPPKEIYAAWPTSFTEGQLRAFKAHITMRTY